MLVNLEMGWRHLQRAAGLQLMLCCGHCKGTTVYIECTGGCGHMAAHGQGSLGDLEGPGDVQDDGNDLVMQHGLVVMVVMG